MSTLPDFDAVYRQDAVFADRAGVPWNLGEPQPPLRALIDGGQIRGPVLDAGCGVAATALYLAERGFAAVGLDHSPTAIEQARARAARRGLPAAFAVADITGFTGYAGWFANILDSTLLHSLPVASRQDYLRAIARAAASGAQLHMLVFSAAAQFPQEGAPNTLTEDELGSTVGRHWSVDSIEPSTITTLFAPVEDDTVRYDPEGRAQLPAFLLTAHQSD